MAKPRPLVAKNAFAVGRRVVKPIDARMLRERVVMSNDPIVKGREHLFTDLLDALGTEQATANPGERRTKPPKQPKADPLTCPDCGRKFKNAGGLSSHQRAKHGDD